MARANYAILLAWIAMPAWALPQFEVSPASVNFGWRDIDAGPGPELQVVVRNSGDSAGVLKPVEVGSWIESLPVPPCPVEVIDGFGPAYLEPNANYTITLRFDPMQAGFANCLLFLRREDFGSPMADTIYVSLTGEGTIDVGLAVAPGSMDFGAIDPLSSRMGLHKVTIENTGDEVVEFRFVGISLLDPEFSVGLEERCDFEAVQDSGQPWLAPGETRIIDVSFTPQIPGQQICHLSVLWTRAGGSFGEYHVVLKGQGNEISGVFLDGFED